MILKNNKWIFVALLSIMPFQTKSGIIDSCIAVGKVSAAVDLAVNLVDGETVEPISSVSTAYNLGFAGYLLGSLGYSLVALPYRLCCGFPEESNVVSNISVVDKATSALCGISTMQDIYQKGCELVPDSVKWAADSVIPDFVKSKCDSAKKFAHDHRYVKGVALAVYVAYKTSQNKITMVDTISNAHGDIALMKMFGTLGCALVPDFVKDSVSSVIPSSVKSTYHVAKEFINKHKIIKGVAFAAYVAYKLSQPKVVVSDTAFSNSVVSGVDAPEADAMTHMAYTVLN